MPKRLLHIPKGLLKLAVFLLFLGAGIVVALVRTQAGRDFLSRQIEAEFAKTFEGSLRIGRLYGNLARTFYATDVSIHDPDGRSVVHVDSLVLRLGLLDGLRRNITVQHAEFVRPRFSLTRNDSTGWNIQRALALRKRDGPSTTTWAFRSADVGIVDASIVTRNMGRRPAAVDSNYVFDFTNSRLDRVSAAATIEWTDRNRLIDLRNLYAFLTSQGLEISSFRSQVAFSDSSVSVNEAALTTPRSGMRMSLRLAGFDSLQVLARLNARIPNVVVKLDNVRIDSTEFASIFPKLKLPDSEVRLLAGGSTGDLHVDELFARLGDATIRAAARLRGWPDSVSFAVDVDTMVINPQRLASIFPNLSRTIAGIPVHGMQAALSGVLQKGPEGRFDLFRSRVGFEAESDLGILGGEFDLSRTRDDTLHYTGQLLMSDYRVDAWLPSLGQTVLNADLEFDGSGQSASSLDGTLVLRARSSMIRGLSYDSVSVEAAAHFNRATLRIDGQGSDGAVSFRGGLDVRQETARLDGLLRLEDFNALAFSAGTPQPGASSLSTVVDVRAEGNSPDHISGTATVVVDTASFYVQADTLSLSPSRHWLTVAHQDSFSTLFELDGDVLEGRLEGQFTVQPLVRTVKLWLGAAAHTIWEQGEKRLHSEDILAAEDIGEEAYSFEESAVREELIDKGFGAGMRFDGRLRVKRMRDLHQLAPVLPETSKEAEVRASGYLSADSLALSVNVNADSVRGNELAMDDLSLSASLMGPFAYSLDQTLVSQIDLNLRALQSGSQRLEDVDIDYVFRQQEGSVRIATSDSALGGLGVFADATFRMLPGWIDLRFADLTVRKNEYAWSTYGPSELRVFGDGIDVGQLEIRSLHNLGEFDRPDQALSILGVISPDPADSLRIEAAFIRLEEISELARFQFAIGGEMHASMTLAHALHAPRVAGDLTVNALTFDGRDLGNLELKSVYSRPTEGIAVDIRVTQPREKTRGVQRNDVHFYGTVRPPGSDPNDHGNLNLKADLTEVDLFFFQYLFPNELADVSGEGTGSGTITGDFSFPVFDASVEFERSSFLVPEFNLRFGITGPVTIDRAGFHLHEVVLTDPTGGRGTMRGDILFNDYKFFSFDIAADLSEIMIMNVSRSMDLSFYGQVWVSGSATLSGPLQQTLLRSVDAVTSQKSRLYLPVTEDEIESDKTFIVFADSAGEFQIEQRESILSKRPQTERAFVEGMDMSFNILIPEESSVFLVFDPLLGDVIHALGSGRVQLQRREGDFQAFGTFTVESGDYLFTAGEVFQRRFQLEEGGTITWDGDPIDARLDIPAVYRTRASLAGLPGQNPEDRVPIRVDMSLTGRVTTPIVDLRIALDLDQRDPQVIPPGLESALNQADLAVEYATSVLLTNTFLLTSNQGSDALTNTADDLLFHSLSQLVSSQLNRFVSQALNLDVNVGVQQGRTEQDYDVIYGFALRLDDQRVVIRGEGLYETGTNEATTAGGIQGAFVVEYRLTPSVQLEFFFRRESDLYRAASSLGTAYGLGIVYQTDFPNWSRFGRRSRGRKEPEPVEETPAPASVPASL